VTITEPPAPLASAYKAKDLETYVATYARNGAKVEDWLLDDPKGKPIERVREIRDDIARRIDALVRREGWTNVCDDASD
jgi:hypothetical protein